MAHEITATDNFIGYQKGGWHGLGHVFHHQIKNAKQAVEEAKLGWGVDQWELEAHDPNHAGGSCQAVKTHVLNVRSDNRTPLGVVGAGYVPCQNLELAEFAFEVAKNSGDDLRLETAGSIRGGRRVWFMLSGVKFNVARNTADPVEMYLLVANGHDGGMAVWIQPTSTRVVCSNTLHAALNRNQQHVRIRHEGKMEKKIEEARRTLQVYSNSVKDFREACDTLAGKAASKEDLNNFFIEAWTRTQFAIPKNPKTEEETRRRNRATDAYTRYCQIVDEDCAKTGRKGKPTLWTGLNAFTQFIQHDKAVRAKGDDAKLESRVFNDLFGSTAAAKSVAFKHALELV